jgi:hypothetical protein
MGLSCSQVRWLLWHRVRSAYAILLEQIIHLCTEYSFYQLQKFLLYHRTATFVVCDLQMLAGFCKSMENSNLVLLQMHQNVVELKAEYYTHDEVGCLPSPWSRFLGRSSPKIDGAISDIHVHVKLLQVPKHTRSSCFRLAQPRHERKHVMSLMSLIMHWSAVQTRNS